jgi:alkylated DNA repair dioxygenase AlkB
MQDADVSYLRTFLSSTEADRYFQTLLADTSWEEGSIKLWGKEHKQPRLIAWHGDLKARYSYSGLSLNPRPWTEVLLEIKNQAELASKSLFNSVLLNLYRSGSDRMGWHSDDEPELGPIPTIASISLGEERVFRFKHKHDKTIKPVSMKLHSGSLLVMRGTTQKFWKHAIERESRAIAPRINLTFRWIHPKGETPPRAG